MQSSAESMMKIERLKNGQISLHKDNTATTVRLSLCFPWSQPNRYISLRDEKNHEVTLINDLEELDDSSREVVEAALAEAGFVFKILSVQSLQSEFEIRNWKVTTQQGTCTFQTELDDWPRHLPDGSILIKDVSGNLFHIASPKELDEKSQKIFWAFMD